MDYFRGVPRSDLHRDGNHRVLRVGKKETTSVFLEAITRPFPDITFSYWVNDGLLAYTFGYVAKPIPEHPSYVLLQAAVAVAQPTDRFEKSVGRAIVSDILANPNLSRHLAIAVHFPMASMIYLNGDGTSQRSRWEFPGSRLVSHAIQNEILSAYAESIQCFNEEIDLVYNDE